MRPAVGVVGVFDESRGFGTVVTSYWLQLQ